MEPTEIQKALEALEKERERIAAYQRLKVNPDFRVFTDYTKQKIEDLRDLLEVAKNDDLANVRGQLQSLRGLYAHFEDTIHRAEQVEERIQLLQKS